MCERILTNTTIHILRISTIIIRTTTSFWKSNIFVGYIHRKMQKKNHPTLILSWRFVSRAPLCTSPTSPQALLIKPTSFVHDWTISSALAMEILQSCTKPPIYPIHERSIIRLVIMHFWLHAKGTTRRSCKAGKLLSNANVITKRHHLINTTIKHIISVVSRSCAQLLTGHFDIHTQCVDTCGSMSPEALIYTPLVQRGYKLINSTSYSGTDYTLR